MGLTIAQLESLATAARAYAEDGLGTSLNLDFIAKHRKEFHDAADAAEQEAERLREAELVRNVRFRELIRQIVVRARSSDQFKPAEALVDEFAAVFETVADVEK